MTTKRETEKIGLKEDALNRAVERWSANNCGRNGVNPTISAKVAILIKS